MNSRLQFLFGRGIGPRLLRNIGGVTVLGVLALVSMMSWQASRTAESEAIESMRANAQGYANEIGGEFSAILSSANTLASSFATLRANEQRVSRAVGDSLVLNALRARPGQFGLWIVFEPNAYDASDSTHAGVATHGPNGWFAPYWVRAGDQLTKADIYEGGSDPTNGPFYHRPRDDRRAFVSDPYAYPVNGQDVLLVTFSTPVIVGDAFIGAVGADVTLTDIQARVARIRPYETGTAELIAPNGVLAASADSSQIGQPATTADSLPQLVSLIAASSTTILPRAGDDIVVRVPVVAEGNDRPWALEVHVPRATVLAPVRRMQLFAMLLAAITLAIVATIIVRAVRAITRPLGTLVTAADRIAEGDVAIEIAHTSADEVGKVADAFRRIVAAQQSLAASATQLAAGDASTAIEPRSGEDVLGNAMSTLRNTVHALVGETNTLITAAREGDLTARGNAARFNGAYADLIGGINETLEATTRPVTVAAGVLEQLANRDLTVRVTGTYRGDHARIQSAVNTAAEALASAMRDVREASERVSVSSREIAAGSDSLAAGASEQAASLEEVSASLQESASMTARNAEHAVDARTLALGTREAAQHGAEAMERLDAAVRRIKHTADSTAKIIRTIDEIAFQTNLLALNAAVEAARAGDAGRGFAVVADEVRALSLRSAEAARQTSSLIEESVAATDAGVRITGEVASGLQRIVEQVATIDGMIEQISAASSEQASGARQITVAIEQMNSVTQQTAASSEESASSAQELAGEAERLRALVDEFRIEDRVEAGSARRTSNQPSMKRQRRAASPIG